MLDCAAGTGFPALRLAVEPPFDDFEIHCTDGDQATVDELAKRASQRRLPLERLTPQSVDGAHDDGVPPDPDRLVVDWQDLDQIGGTYDYVMCRGNSLAYDHSWGGGRLVTSLEQVAKHLRQITTKVQPGGWLHVDAPWDLALGSRTYCPIHGEIAAIWEQVTPGPGFRQWRIIFKYHSGRIVRFRRFSSPLVIADIGEILDRLGFERTTPGRLGGERRGFGVIIARRRLR